MFAGMPLSSFLLFHCALVVVVDDDGGHVAIGLSLSQQCLLLAHGLRYLLPQLSTFWHITIEGEVISDKHALLKTNDQSIMSHLIKGAPVSSLAVSIPGFWLKDFK